VKACGENNMSRDFTTVISALFQPKKENNRFVIFDPAQQFDPTASAETTIVRALNAAFFIALAGKEHPAFGEAIEYLKYGTQSSKWAEIATFYLNGINRLQCEIDAVSQQAPDFASRLTELAEWLANPSEPEELSEKTWSVFFPEATNLRQDRANQIEALRAKRTVTITRPNPTPITDPAREILFTSNVLLTNPAASTCLEELPFSPAVKSALAGSMTDIQLYWYDHPIQIGVGPESNEILYGLRGLEAALEVERTRGNLPEGVKATCVLSVSVTHEKLQHIAKSYLEQEFERSGGLKNLDLYVFSEADTQRLVTKVLIPAAKHYLGRDDAAELLEVFGVDGEYGRHYSFLKALAPLWQILIQPDVKATFKIDLDQVFPQPELVEQTGLSALEHFKTALWGAQGIDSAGQPVELGMLAGALVNESDIAKSLFFPDVLFPNRPLSADEHIFFSTLPQALSTEAEILTRYTSAALDGKSKCIQRIHVTGGTNGILIDSLRRYRPFTPSFFGRAEDQAYLLSVLAQPGTRLAYAHADGLIMRHDKEAFAQEAIQAAFVGKLVGDYIRTLYFSAYARVLTDDVAGLKALLNPFTGCFVSAIPATVVYLRFGLKAASFFSQGQDEQGLEFIANGAPRIQAAFDFVEGENSPLKRQYQKEQQGWQLYYDILAALEKALNQQEAFALELSQQAKSIVKQCAVRFSA
jgi:hypothetical protein